MRTCRGRMDDPFMKNQYIGDIGDYGKYGLLRFLHASGVSTGVNWYLNPDDGQSDGSHTEYLLDERMRAYDPEVYDAMKRIAFQPGKTIQMVEGEAMLRGIQFYNAVMDFSSHHWGERPAKRMEWHTEAMRKLQGCELVFADPDNGLSTTVKPTQKGAQKHILPSEIVDYFQRGQQVLFYQHRSRKSAAEWQAQITRIKSFLPEARLLALSFHRWSARTYVFVVHEEKYPFYCQIVEGFIHTSWGSCAVDGRVPFTAEGIS